MSLALIQEPNNLPGIARAIEKLGGAEVTLEVHHALDCLRKDTTAVMLVRQLCSTQASQIIQRMTAIRSDLSICFVTTNPSMEALAREKAVTVITDPESAASEHRLDELLTTYAAEAKRAYSIESPLRIGRYLVDSQIGCGGEGIVYRAWDPVLKRRVAVKVCTKTRFPNLQLTQAEGVHNCRVDHPNVVRVLDCVETNESIALILELIDGGDLASLLQRHRRLPRPLVYRMAIDLAEALEAVHKAGLVHRDIKPSNVLIADDSRFLLTDFGSSHEHGRDLEQQVLGNPGFAPPEAYLDGVHSKRGDIYSLGVLLFRALTGKMPFEGNSLVDVMDTTISGPTPSCRRAEPNRDISRLIGAMLAKDPLSRPSFRTIRATFRKRLRAGIASIDAGLRSSRPTVPAHGPVRSNQPSSNDRRTGLMHGLGVATAS